MEDRIFKIAMLHLESSVTKESATVEDIKNIKKLIDIVKGDSDNEEIPEIKSKESFYEAASGLGFSKQDLPKVIMSILRISDTRNLPSGLVGDIGEHLGDKKGIGLIPVSVLERTFLREDLDKKIGPNKWEFFFKDEKKLKEFKEQKGF